VIGKGRVAFAAGVPVLLLALLLFFVLAGCSGDSPEATEPASPGVPSPSVRTLSPLPAPPTSPATGRLYADLRQSSRDAALGRMQVWVRNDREKDLRPTRITYLDGRFHRPLAGGRLRLNPARSIRGYTLTLPRRPACGSDATSGQLVVEHDGRREELPVEDEADVVARYVATRCLELRVAAVADLSFADDVPADRPGEGGVGTLTLVVRPSGRPGPSLTVESVAGTPLLSAYRQPVWTPGLTVRGTDDPVRVDLPVHPARCDEHVFMESGGATAFRVRLRLGATAGELILRMSPRGAANAIAYARDACGYDS
jgi:hypothetical protein